MIQKTTNTDQNESQFIQSAREFDQRVEELRLDFPSFFAACFPDYRSIDLRGRDYRPRDSRGSHMARVTRAIEEHGPKTIREISNITGINRPSIANCMYSNNRGVFESVPGTSPKVWRLIAKTQEEKALES